MVIKKKGKFLMKKYFFITLSIILSTTTVFAATAFDSMDSATEVKLAPMVKPQPKTTVKQVSNVNTYKASATIKEQKFNEALINLDDAQVELRQELAVLTSKYNEALSEKEKAISNCKILKKEIKDIDKKMKNVEKSKQIINKNLTVKQ